MLGDGLATSSSTFMAAPLMHPTVWALLGLPV
jgi:hypothetical protein